MSQKNQDRPMTPEERALWRCYRPDVQDMRIMDDVFMQSFFQGQKHFVQEVVRTIVDNDELVVVRMSTQFNRVGTDPVKNSLTKRIGAFSDGLAVCQ